MTCIHINKPDSYGHAARQKAQRNGTHKARILLVDFGTAMCYQMNFRSDTSRKEMVVALKKLTAEIELDMI